jgi:hypothetical protein
MVSAVFCELSPQDPPRPHPVQSSHIAGGLAEQGPADPEASRVIEAPIEYPHAAHNRIWYVDTHRSEETQHLNAFKKVLAAMGLGKNFTA